MKQYLIEVVVEYAIVVYSGVVAATDRLDAIQKGVRILMASEYGLDDRPGAVSNVSFRVRNL